ncbi:hypothetical protein CEXT_591911 [Caerostris extrusa]|uniref:RNase H type-1 domain-containing protein n=1 Tax=Caerostris extrusa TaxID=172846 RepID=A0AAV4W6W6_CAEEX|nr:hypothetical protein CEXT_591911 [Caerostris extrusa]
MYFALDNLYQYPKNNWIHIYTDGSKMLDNVGGGVHSELFAFPASLGPIRTNFDRELEAIRVENKQISVTTVHLNIVVFSDSL